MKKKKDYVVLPLQEKVATEAKKEEEDEVSRCPDRERRKTKGIKLESGDSCWYEDLRVRWWWWEAAAAAALGFVEEGERVWGEGEKFVEEMRMSEWDLGLMSLPSFWY